MKSVVWVAVLCWACNTRSDVAAATKTAMDSLAVQCKTYNLQSEQYLLNMKAHTLEPQTRDKANVLLQRMDTINTITLNAISQLYWAKDVLQKSMLKSASSAHEQVSANNLAILQKPVVAGFTMDIYTDAVKKWLLNYACLRTTLYDSQYWEGAGKGYALQQLALLTNEQALLQLKKLEYSICLTRSRLHECIYKSVCVVNIQFEEP